MSEHSHFDDHEHRHFLTVKEAAGRYGCTPEYMARLCRNGEISAYLSGRIWQVAEDDVERLIEKMGRARSVRSTRLSKARKKEYESHEGRAALYGALFEAIAALPRERTVPPAPLKRSPPHRNPVVERAAALLIALVAVFGNYALISGQGAALAVEVTTLARSVQGPAADAFAALGRATVHAEGSASVWGAVTGAYSAFRDRLYADTTAGKRRQALPRPAAAQPQEALATGTPDVLKAKTLRAEELCIGEVCLTESALLELTEKK